MESGGCGEDLTGGPLPMSPRCRDGRATVRVRDARVPRPVEAAMRVKRIGPRDDSDVVAANGVGTPSRRHGFRPARRAAAPTSHAAQRGETEVRRIDRHAAGRQPVRVD